jgi:multidrug resistance protein, MATE family
MRYPSKPSKTYLFQLSIPIFFSNLALPLVGLVDTALMGHLGSVKFLAATSVGTSVITMIFWSFGFLRMGTVGLVAQALGRGDYREIVMTTIRNLCIALIIGFFIFFLKNPIISVVNSFFNASDEVHLLINKYISIRALAAPAELSLYVITGLFLGLQMTKTSSFMIIFFCSTNILLSIYFVKNLNLDIYGVALGTTLSAYLTYFIFLSYAYYFIKKKFNLNPKIYRIFSFKKITKLFHINFDIFIRTLLLTFSFMWFTFQSSKLGEDYLAINTILLQFVIISSFFLDAYAFATEGVVGYSVGKKIKKSFLHVVKSSFKLSFITGLIISLIYIFSFKYLINTLTDIDYLRYLSYGFAMWVILIPPIASFCYQYDGIFVGASQTKEMRNGMIISVIVYIYFSIMLVEVFNNHGLWLSLMIFMIIRSLTLKFYFPNILKKLQ